MRYFSQLGRTMLETIMIMGIIGVLSVTGIYMYNKAMTSVRADAIIKDVLLNASQNQANAESSKMGGGKQVYTPKYGGSYYGKQVGVHEKGEFETSTKIKGRYGYYYKITKNDLIKTGANKGRYVVIKTSDQEITPEICGALKSKLLLYGNNQKDRVICMSKTNPAIPNCKTAENNYINSACPDTNSENFYFVVNYSCSAGAVSCDPLICDTAHGWYKDGNHCELCPAGWACSP